MLSSPAASSSSLFAILPARPPTPPRDITKHVDNALRFLQEGHHDPNSEQQVPASNSRSPIDTPPPRSSAGPRLRSSATGKKVDFSPQLTFFDVPPPGHLGSPLSSSRRPTPTQRELRPLRSILKPALERLPLTPDDYDSKLSYFSPEEPGSFRRMFQSVLNQLASQSREDRRDAYIVINGALKTYEGVPEPEAIVEKKTLLQQFLTRDIGWKDSSGRLDAGIITPAITLACVLLLNPQTSSALDSDFRTFIIDRSILMIEQSDVPKAIVKNHMFLLAQQRFHPSIMTPARAEKLVNALQTVEERCTGNSLISCRLIVYQRLLEQAPGTMLNRMRDWIEAVFHGLMSSIPDIRSRAIDTCSKVGMSLGHHAQAAKVVLEALEKPTDDEHTYGDFINQRLMEMTADKDIAKFVPQIWAAIILVFRCKRKPIQQWPKFKDWLLTIQRSLNSGDLEVKQHANVAWNKLVFSVMPDAHTSESMRSMLRVPIVTALDKRGHDRFSQYQRQIGMDSYCNLLHYGLRPSLSHTELDTAWSLYVQPVLASLAQSRSKGQLSACRIIHGLLTKSHGAWNSNAANEQGTIKPDELPQLDAKWVRTRLNNFMEILEPITQTGMWMSPETNQPLDNCWQLLFQTVAEAGKQEVKTSSELKEAMAQLINFFRRLWTAESEGRSEKEGSVWIHRYQDLLQMAVHYLGAGHFVEDILSKTKADEIEAIPTPSHRSSKHAASAHSAFTFLFALYYQPRPEVRAGGFHRESMTWFLALLAGTKGSMTGMLTLLHRSLQFASCLHSSGDIPGQLWHAVADTTENSLKVQTAIAGHRSAQVMGIVLRSALNILLDGLRYADSSSSCLSKAVNLYSTLCQTAKHYGNDAGIALGVMEPFAKSLVEGLDDIPTRAILVISQRMLDYGVWTKSKQELDQSRKALWAASLEIPKTGAYHPFEHVYNLLNGVFLRAYNQSSGLSSRTLQPFTSFVLRFVEWLRRCPLALLPHAMQQTQAGVVMLVEDRDRKYFPLSQSASQQAITPSAIVVEMCSDLLHLIDEMSPKDSTLLQSLEPLVTAALSSPSKDIVNKTIVFWNRSFGQDQQLQYPDRILPVLRARHAQTDMLLPNLLVDGDNVDIAHLPAFAESQVDPTIVPDFVFNSTPRSAFEINGLDQVNDSLVGQRLASRNIVRDNISKSGGSSKKSTPNAKLRHDDSQIEFAPIESRSNESPASQGSQLLTEHQKEVRLRQQGDAQMFPDMSSSPAAQSSGKRKGIAKRLDFTSDASYRQDDEVTVATPTGLADGNPMSDDLPSSPTPRASMEARTTQDVPQYSDDEETICDPPSSPPQQEKVMHPNNTILAELTTLDLEGDLPRTDISAEQQEQGTIEPLPGDVGSDLSSDTRLPNAQLEREAALAEAEDGDTNLDMDFHSFLLDDAEDVIEQPQNVSQEESRPCSQTLSRIEDSMLEQNDQGKATFTEMEANAPQGHQGGRKRRRNTEKTYAFGSKKRIKVSPKLLLAQSQSPEDEDIGEEIIVASSQHRPSPVAETIESNLSDVVLEDEPEIIQHAETRKEQPVKRKRGRSFKKTKARKSARRSQDDSEADSSSRREVAMVLISPPPPHLLLKHVVQSDMDDEEEEDDQLSPDKQLSQEESTAATRTRVIAQPKSILGRLRGLLEDCKTMVFGSQEEEREFDDVLFEIRREVHEAGNRKRRA